MRDDTPSRTAAWVAAVRQLGQLLPDGVRLADDPYGAAFTSRWLAALIEQAAAGEPAPGAGEHGPPALGPLDLALRRLRSPIAALPGLRTWIVYMQVRTRLIDDAIRAFAAGGGAQVVLLGAGYDCRALRMRELAGARVFEIDHPATQRHKRATLARMGAASRATYVTWNFEEQPLDDLPDVLAEAGHDAARATFTVWEGVTMYLTEPAIDASLRAIAAWSAPGSRLAMTYFARSRLARPSLVTRAVRAAAAVVGEPWRFGWEPAELPAYLGARGFSLDADVALPDAARELLPPELAAELGGAARRLAIAASTESVAIARR